MKVNDKNTRIENLQNRQEKYGVPRVRVQLRQKFKKTNYNFFKFLVEIAFNGYLDKFLT